MSTTRSSGLLRRSARRSTSRKSVLMSRSCTSSIITCDVPSRLGSRISRRSNTPVVTNSTLAPSSRGAVPCRRTENPTECPHFSPRSAATRSATETAAMRRGCVTTTRVSAPFPRRIASSRMYCGHCVDFPDPVPPDTTTTGDILSASQSSSRIRDIGKASRASRIAASGPDGSASAAAARAASSAANDASIAARVSASTPSVPSVRRRAASSAFFLRRRYPPSPASASRAASSASSSADAIARASAVFHARMRAS